MLRDLCFFRVSFWSFISFFWLGRISLPLCMLCNLLLRFKHLKKTPFPVFIHWVHAWQDLHQSAWLKVLRPLRPLLEMCFLWACVCAFICLNFPNGLPLLLLESPQSLAPPVPVCGTAYSLQLKNAAVLTFLFSQKTKPLFSTVLWVK